MQTFLPYVSIKDSLYSLDDKRLGKQRVECLQILNTLDPDHDSRGWENHPAVKMWRGYEGYLALYALTCCEAWAIRGMQNRGFDKPYSNAKTEPKIRAYVDKYTDMFGADVPPWWYDNRIHRSHQSNLLRKNPEHYRSIFGPDVPDNLPYYWPV
tara:strand:+ start:2690 stop:3151 length:462 start_codon:yes stop_codon:yes gene_type:complete